MVDFLDLLDKNPGAGHDLAHLGHVLIPSNLMKDMMKVCNFTVQSYDL